MRKNIIKLLVICMVLLAMPMKQYGQQPYEYYAEEGIILNFHEIEDIDLRLYLLYNLEQSDNFTLTPDVENGVFIVTGKNFESFYNNTYTDFSFFSKEDRYDLVFQWKESVSPAYFASIMMDVASRKTRNDNDHCIDSDPFCTSETIQFEASSSTTQAESIPDKGCLGMTYNPSWFHMRIRTPGQFIIHMEGRDPNNPNTKRDIDYCIWGPFTHPTTPCTSQLTTNKIIDCSYSSSYSENAYLGYPGNQHSHGYSGNHGTINFHVPEEGEYYILLITNFSCDPCIISFTKTAGSGPGETDCDIVPAIASNTGPYCVGQTIQLHVNEQEGASYSWTGPNFTSTSPNPTRPNCAMNMAGTYTCVTTVGTHSVTASTDVVVYAQPNANFNATSVCVGNPTSFTNASTSNPSNQSMSFHWNFGDGQSSIETNPVHQYATAGSYSVTLTASCGDGQCTSTKTKTVTVYNQPVAHASAPQSVEYGQKATLTGSGGGNGNFNYHWEPENLVENPNAQTTLTHELTALQNNFTLTVTNPDNNECVSTDEVTILVEGSNLTATANALPNVICLGDTTQLQAIAVGGTPNRTYLWEPAGSLISAPNTANPKACPTETTTYNCTIEDGLTTVNVSVTVTVNYPEYEEMDRYICPDGEYPFYDQTCTAEGDYEYHTTTAQGCEKIITLHLHHYPSYPNAHTTEAYICPGDYYPFQGSNYYAQGLHPVTLSTIHGCDSVVWLDLKVYPANDTIVEERDICVSDTLIWYGNAYFTDGDEAYFDDMDVNGCLLVRKLHLRVGQYQSPPGDYNPNVYQCVAHDEEPHYRWEIAGRDYYTDTRDTIIIPNPNPQKCDYLYTLNLKFHKETLVTDTVTVCDEYKWDVTGATFTSTNHHIEHDVDIPFGPNNTCRDTTYVLDLTVNHSSRSTIDTTACNEFHWDFGWNHEADTTITEIGSHSFERMIRTTHGCDSIVTMNVQLDKSPVFNKINGNTWVVGGSEFQFTVETYTINTTGTHETSWRLTYKNGDPFTKWDLVDFTDGCLVYIYTFELDTIYLHATTKSVGQGSEICGNLPNTKDKMIICTAYGTPEITRDCHVDIYPNPNDGNMTLSFTNMSGEILVKVFNMRGTQIDQFQVYNGYESRTYSYNSSRLTPGIYLFSIASREGTLIKKVVVM